jgi:hypothetical protein
MTFILCGIALGQSRRSRVVMRELGQDGDSVRIAEFKVAE